MLTYLKAPDTTEYCITIRHQHENNAMRPIEGFTQRMTYQCRIELG